MFLWLGLSFKLSLLEFIHLWIMKVRMLWRYLLQFFIIPWFSSVSHSVLSDSTTPWAVPYQAPAHGIFPGKYWSGFPFPRPGSLGSNPCLLSLLHWQADSPPLSHLGSRGCHKELKNSEALWPLTWFA